jgi:hypothetical protein
MSMEKELFTPGPLYVVKDRLKSSLINKSCLIICTGTTDSDVGTSVVFGKSDDDTSMHGDAALYAAAPAMYAALKLDEIQLVNCVPTGPHSGALKAVRDAMTLATKGQ